MASEAISAIKALINRLTDALLSEYMARKFSPGQSLEDAQQEYRNELALTMLEYYESDRPITAFRNQYRRATNDAFEIVFIAGWADGDGMNPMPDAMRVWLNGQISAQMGYIDGVFEELKALRKEGDRSAADAFIGARADGYSYALQGVYSYAKMNAAKLKMGIWRLGATEKNCTTCKWLSGIGIRTLKWFLDNGYIPRQAGSPTLECGGYHCDCGIYHPETGERLIP